MQGVYACFVTSAEVTCHAGLLLLQLSEAFVVPIVMLIVYPCTTVSLSIATIGTPIHFQLLQGVCVYNSFVKLTIIVERRHFHYCCIGVYCYA